MARSINGNLMGKASHKDYDVIETDWAKYPESTYWRQGAEWAKAQIYNSFEDTWVTAERIEKILSRFYNKNNTWMTICLKTERMLSLINKIRRDNEKNNVLS